MFTKMYTNTDCIDDDDNGGVNDQADNRSDDGGDVNDVMDDEDDDDVC